MSATYQFLAVGGDCSAEGMSSENETLPIPDEHLRLAFLFIRAQTDQQERSALSRSGITREFEAVIKACQEYCFALKEVGIFKHKWHYRTDWIIQEIES